MIRTMLNCKRRNNRKVTYMNDDGKPQMTGVLFALIFFVMLSMIVNVTAYLNFHDLRDAQERIRQLEMDLQECRLEMQ